MKIKLALLSIILLYSFQKQTYAGEPLKGSFSGVVKDAKTNRPLVSVSVYITDTRQGCRTNERGEFSIHNISEGKHLVEVSHIGYNTIAENVNIQGATTMEFLLSESIVENNVVVVTGVTRATQLKRVPFQVESLKKQDLFESATSNIIEGLTRKPGVSSLSSGPSISKPVIRGLGYNRVLVINDGVRQEGQQWGDEHGIEIDESSVKKIEILKGPASLIYGSDAMAGVINIISNLPVPENSIQANVGSNYQTNNRLRSLNGNLAGNINGFNWNLYGDLIAASDYKNRFDGPVFNSKFNEHNYGGFAGINKSWGYSHLMFSNFNMKTGLIEGLRDDNGNFVKSGPGGLEELPTQSDFLSTHPQIPYQHIRHFKFSTDNHIKIGKAALNVNLGWQQNRREEFGNPDDVNERNLFFDLKTFTYTGRLLLREKNGWKPSFGINGMQQENQNRGLEQLIPDYSLFDFGGYGYVQKEMGKFTFSGGARYDTRQMHVHNLMDGNNIKSDGFSRSFSSFSGSVGATLQATKSINLKLNVSRAFRAPGISELASNGAHEGTNRYEYGNSNLNSEISTQVDAAIDLLTTHFSFNLSGYYNGFSNFIFYRKLQNIGGADSVVVVDGNALTAFTFNQKAAHLAGIEATLDVHPHPLDWLHFQNTFSLVQGRLRDEVEGNKNLPFIPATKLLTEVRTDFKQVGNFMQHAFIKFEMENMFKQAHPFTAYNTETATPAYMLLNAGLGADVVSRKGKTLCSINFTAMNLANVAYQNHLSRLKYLPQNLATGRTGVYNMGRNFSIKVNIPLSFSLNHTR